MLECVGLCGEADSTIRPFLPHRFMPLRIVDIPAHHG